MTKVCTKCGLEKELSSYYKHPRRKDGRGSACRDCLRLRDRELYYEKKQKLKEEKKNELRDEVKTELMKEIIAELRRNV